MKFLFSLLKNKTDNFGDKIINFFFGGTKITHVRLTISNFDLTSIPLHSK